MSVRVKKKKVRITRYKGEMIKQKEKNVRHFKMLIFTVFVITAIASAIYAQPIFKSEKIVHTPFASYTFPEAATKMILLDVEIKKKLDSAPDTAE